MRPGMSFVLTCREVTEHATDYMEGALPVRTRWAVRLHLLLCRMCRAYVVQLRRTVGLLRGRALVGRSAAVETRIIRLVKEGQGSALDPQGGGGPLDPIS